MLTTLIVEDESLGYRRLRHLLGAAPDVDVIGWARDAESAIDAIRSHQPRVVFLDIELVSSSGLQVIRSKDLGQPPLFVFVSAHARYAVDAFDLAAVDYLLKPYTDSRLDEALERVRRAVMVNDPGLGAHDTDRGVRGSSTMGVSAARASGDHYLRRLIAQWRGRLRVVPVAEIDWIEADGVYARIHIGETHSLIRESLSNLDARLDPSRFCRVHRSAIINLDRIGWYSRAGGVYAVQLIGGVRVPVGRTYRKALERRLGRL